MSKKGRRYTPEQIITKLREAEVLQSQGMSIEEVVRKFEIASQTYYRWRKEYGGRSHPISAVLVRHSFTYTDISPIPSSPPIF